MMHTNPMSLSIVITASLHSPAVSCCVFIRHAVDTEGLGPKGTFIHSENATHKSRPRVLRMQVKTPPQSPPLPNTSITTTGRKPSSSPSPLLQYHGDALVARRQRRHHVHHGALRLQRPRNRTRVLHHSEPRSHGHPTLVRPLLGCTLNTSCGMRWVGFQ